MSQSTCTLMFFKSSAVSSHFQLFASLQYPSHIHNLPNNFLSSSSLSSFNYSSDLYHDGSSSYLLSSAAHASYNSVIYLVLVLPSRVKPLPSLSILSRSLFFSAAYFIWISLMTITDLYASSFGITESIHVTSLANSLSLTALSQRTFTVSYMNLNWSCLS